MSFRWIIAVLSQGESGPATTAIVEKPSSRKTSKKVDAIASCTPLPFFFAEAIMRCAGESGKLLPSLNLLACVYLPTLLVSGPAASLDFRPESASVGPLSLSSAST